MKISGYKLAFAGLVAALGAGAAGADDDTDFRTVCQNSQVVSRLGGSFNLCVNAQRDAYQWAQERRNEMRDNYDHCVQVDEEQGQVAGQQGHDWARISQCMRDRRDTRSY